MPIKASDDDPEKARRFREAALPYLDDAYTLARYLLRNAADAEDAVQECYLRAFRHFDSYRGPAMKPWLFAILRNVCRAEYARRATAPTSAIEDVPESAEQAPLWHEAEETPEAQLLRRWDADTIRRLVAALAEPFRETFVLREIQNLSYREIAEVAEVPVGTVMSRLARARAMLRSAWLAEEEQREMTCDEAEVLLHALIDGELDAGHAREVESHIAGCPRCAAALRDYREMSKAIAEAGVRYTAPAALRQAYRGCAAAAARRRRIAAPCCAALRWARRCRRWRRPVWSRSCCVRTTSSASSRRSSRRICARCRPAISPT